MSNFDQAIQLDPSFAEAYTRKGMVFYLLRAPEEALQMFEKAARLGDEQAVQLAEVVRNSDLALLLQLAEQEAKRGNKQAVETVRLIEEQMELGVMMEDGTHELACNAIMDATLWRTCGALQRSLSL